MALDKWEKQHVANIAKYEKEIQQIYATAIAEASQMASRVNFDPSKPFAFSDYPLTKALITKLQRKVASDIEAIITKGVDTEFGLSQEKAEELAQSVYSDVESALMELRAQAYILQRNKAREAFLTRKEAGLSLSDRVWRYTGQFKEELEMALDLGLRDGLSADELSREVRKYLNNPNMLFRRVRDEHGVLHLSKRAKAYHPGQGVYRSSYKNARRLTATETNMAYRTADYNAYQALSFVVGIRIMLSNNHTLNGEPFFDICDNLSAPNGSTATKGKGCYPKDFKFTGWHPLCRCFMQTIHKTKEELQEDRRRMREGLPPLPPEQSANYVGDVPDEFKAWCRLNAGRVERAKSLPYFIRDNQDYYDAAFKKKALTPLELAEQRHAQRTPEQVQAIKNRWQQSRIKANFSPEIIANNSVLDNTLPVSQGQPMTFREADEMKANPLYSLTDAIKLGYRHNCQTCTVAYELRRRGYNIEALPNPILRSKVREVDAMPISWKERYLNADGTSAEYQWSNNSVRIGLHKIKWIDSHTTDVGRYEVYCAWKRGGAHVFIIERQKNGNLLWFDPQSGKIGSEIRLDYIGEMKGNLIGVMRIDDKLINTQFSSRFIKAR